MVITEKDIKLHKLMKTMLQSIVDIKNDGSGVEVVFKHYAGLHDQSMHGNRYGSTVNDAGEVVASLVHGGNLQNRANEHFNQDEGHARALEAQRQARAMSNAQERHATGENANWKWQVGQRSYTNAKTVDDFKSAFPDIQIDDANLTTTDIKALNAFGASLKNMKAGNPDLVDSIKTITFEDLKNTQGKGDSFGKVVVTKNGDVKLTISKALSNSPTSATTALTHAEAAGLQPKGCTTLAFPAEKVMGKAQYTNMKNSENVHLTSKNAEGQNIYIFDEKDGTGTVKGDAQHITKILSPDVTSNTKLFGTDMNKGSAASGKNDYQNTFATLVAAPSLGNKDIDSDRSVQKFSNFYSSVMSKNSGVDKSDAVSIQQLKAKADAPDHTDADVITYRNAQSAMNYYRRQTGLTKGAVSSADAELHGRKV